MERLRVATWNLWWRFGDDPDARLAAIEATLRAVDADVVCLQEVWGRDGGIDQARTLADGLGLAAVRHVERFHRGWSFGTAILSRLPVVESGREQLPDLTGESGFRELTWAVLDGPHGRWPIITTHLAHRFDESAVRRVQVEHVMRRVAAMRGGESDPPVVVAGDFNAVPDSDEVRALTGLAPPPVEGLVMNDCWPIVSNEPGHTWDPVVPYLADSQWPRRRLDYVFVSWPRPRRLGTPRSGRLFGAEPVDGVWPSDHLGVVIDLDARAPVPRARPNFDD